MLQIVVANVNGQLYGIDITIIQDINHVPTLTKLPGADIVGMYNFRGKVISVLDLASIIGQGEIETDAKKVIVVTINNRTFAVLVSDVEEIINIEDTDIQQSPIENDRIFGIVDYQGHLVVLLDLNIS